MAGHNDRDGIAVIRHPHRPKSLWPSNRAGDIAIRPGLTVRNRQQCPPAVQLKSSATEIERKTELPPVGREILLKFTDIPGHPTRLDLEAYALGLGPQIQWIGTDGLLPGQSPLEFERH